jgi:hypothetical protein
LVHHIHVDIIIMQVMQLGAGQRYSDEHWPTNPNDGGTICTTMPTAP